MRTATTIFRLVILTAAASEGLTSTALNIYTISWTGSSLLQPMGCCSGELVLSYTYDELDSNEMSWVGAMISLHVWLPVNERQIGLHTY